MRDLRQIFQFASNFVGRGPVYAMAVFRTNSPVPLDAEENWRFWTEQSPASFWLGRVYPLEQRRKSYIDSMLELDHASGIESHYDVSNDFYALFLDREYRFYSCAKFTSDQESLEDAQKNKAEHLLSLLDLHGDERVLELGCGWGSMMKFLQDKGHRGALMGFTLSKDQAHYVRNKFGFDVSLTDLVTEPYLDAPYNRILGVGVIEHVKPNELEIVYKKMHDALIPGGSSVQQFFSLEREPYPSAMVVSQLFFPGSLLAMHSTHYELAERAGFRITHDSVDDYRPTLKAWYDRLSQNRDKAIKLVGLKTYNHYMTYLVLSWLFFELKEAKLHRIVFTKPHS